MKGIFKLLMIPFAIAPLELIAGALSGNCTQTQGTLKFADGNLNMCIPLQKIGIHNPQCDCTKNGILR